MKPNNFSGHPSDEAVKPDKFSGHPSDEVANDAD
jgi:hypothetical protein